MPTATISMNRTTNSVGGDEFSRNDELSFYRSDELSVDGDEFYSEKTILLPLSRLVSYSMFLSFPAIRFLQKMKLQTSRKVSLTLLTEFCFSKKKLHALKSVIAIYTFWSLPEDSTFIQIVSGDLAAHMHLDDPLRLHDSHVREHFSIKIGNVKII